MPFLLEAIWVHPTLASLWVLVSLWTLFMAMQWNVCHIERGCENMLLQDAAIWSSGIAMWPFVIAS